ncbi:uridine kinase [Bryobacter aggregatus]|uniref:uridine kinase n=1 Tax=Bryobacter aggregatus TaxID=360054 RepID=UPI0004E183EC|nr:uridine kinase [Bryobacter aggregatus]
MSPLLVGIAGPSCSGKTELARGLARQLHEDALLFALDHYYNDRSHIEEPERSNFNFDHPDTLDAKLLIKDIESLKNGLAIEQPRYSFVTHSRLEDTEPVAPRPIILIEGLFSLYWEELRNLLDLRVYVETNDEECFRRRLRRDVTERGRTPESIQEQYCKNVRPMALAYVRPSAAFADLTVSGVVPLDTSIRLTLNAIEVRRLQMV